MVSLGSGISEAGLLKYKVVFTFLVPCRKTVESSSIDFPLTSSSHSTLPVSTSSHTLLTTVGHIGPSGHVVGMTLTLLSILTKVSSPPSSTALSLPEAVSGPGTVEDSAGLALTADLGPLDELDGSLGPPTKTWLP